MTIPVDVSTLSVAYRRLVVWVGVQIVVGTALRLSVLALGQSPLAFLLALFYLVFLLASAIVLAIYAYRTSTALGSRLGLLWALAMIVPLVNLITLLALSSKSTRACRQAGVQVGFLGPKLSQSAGGAHRDGVAG